MVATHLGNQVRKELNAVINVGSELPSDNPLRAQLISKKDDLETCLDESLNCMLVFRMADWKSNLGIPHGGFMYPWNFKST